MGTNKQSADLHLTVLNTQREESRFHQDAELLYVLEGAMDIRAGEQEARLPREGIYVVNGNRPYSFTASGDILFVRLAIPTGLVCQNSGVASAVFWCDSTRDENGSYDELRRVLKRLLNRHLGAQGRSPDFGCLSLCYELLDLLCTSFLLRETDRESGGDGAHFEERVAQIDSYMRANFSQPISSKDLSEKLYLSQGYLSRFFKKNFGMSFSEYLTKIRLTHVIDDLLYSSDSITHIALDNGFTNMAAFNKVFREHYGEAPSAMRKKLKKQNRAQGPEENPVVRERLEEFLRTDGAVEEPVGGTAVQAACPVSDSKPLQNAWGDTVNIGAAADLLKSEVREHIAILADSLKFRYVRFWNLFSREMLIDPHAPGGAYNFSKLDSILDFLVEKGLKPHIELGTKPRRLYRTVQSAIVEEDPAAELSDEAFGRFLRAMMGHLLRRYRREELDTWRLELWFPERFWGQEGAAEKYYAKFGVLYRTVKQYAEGLEVGGCGLRLGYIGAETSEREFLEGWQRQAVQPDFVSMLVYAYKRGESGGDRYSKQSVDNDILAHTIAGMNTLMAQAGWGQKKVYVTEWNLTISDRNFINDSSFKGAYILKNILDAYGQVDMLSYFLGSDLVSEHYDSDGLLYGGSGLLSKDGILKAAGYAFRFLSWLYSFYVGKGKNYLVTTDGHDSYAIVCHNQKPLNHNYYLSKEDEIQREHIWKYFDDREPLELTLELTGVSDGSYQVKIYQISEQAGDALQTWGEMGFETELTRNDIKYLKRMCGPKLTIQTVEAKGGALPLTLSLAANEICFVRVRFIE